MLYTKLRRSWRERELETEAEAETATETGKRKDEPNRQTDKQTQRGGRTENSESCESCELRDRP